MACPRCGTPYVDHANSDDVDATVPRPLSPPPLPSPGGIITSVPGPTDAAPATAQPFGQPSAFSPPPLPSGASHSVPADPEPTKRSGVSPKLIVAIVAVLALIGGGAALLLSGGDDDKTVAPTVTTAAGADNTTAAEGPSTTQDVGTTSTIVETTAGPTTTSPYVGPGVNLVAGDPLPSGVTKARASDALPYAQLFADRIADGDWAGVASMVTTLPPTAEQLEASFGRVDRFSLIVLDAADDGFGVTLQLAGVANESDGTTTVRCLRWTVNPDGLSANGAYDAAIVAQFSEQRTAEEVLADTAAMDSIRAQCALV